MAVHEPKVNEVGFQVVKQVIEALPENILERQTVTAGEDVERSFRLVKQHLHDARQIREDLMMHASTHIQIYGAEAFQSVCKSNKEQLDSLEAELARVELLVRQPKIENLAPLLQTVKRVGFDTFWEEASVPEKRAMVSAVISKLTIVEPAKRYVEDVLVEPHTWVTEYVKPMETYRIPKLKRN